MMCSKKICMVIFLGILLGAPLFSQSKFSIRLTGGLSIFDEGDVNRDIRELHKFTSHLNGGSRVFSKPRSG
jgi:hypothetical protein